MNTRNPFQTALVLGVIPTALCADARAEIVYRIPGDFGWRKSLPLHLILENEVVADLGLSEAAVKKLRQLHEQIQAEVEEERRQAAANGVKAPEPARWVRRYDWNDASLHSVRNRHASELHELLTTQQQERLYQIQLQTQRKPTDALCDPGVADTLELKDAQRSEIHQRCWEVVKAEMDEVKLGGRYNGPGSATLDKNLPQAVMKILSDEQRQMFEKIKGPPWKSK